MTTVRELVSALAERRRELRMTQDELAVLTGLSTTSISAIEVGKTSPTATTLVTLADALDVKITLKRGRKLVPKPKKQPQPREVEKEAPAEGKKFGKHGDVHTYWHGCRCNDCARAYQQYRAKKRREYVIPPLDDPRHGARGAHLYTMGCRCEPCCKAAAERRGYRYYDVA